MRSLAPRSEAERGEGRVRGRFSARPPHPILHVASTRQPSPRKRGEGAITTTARVLISHHFSNSRSRSRGAFCARVLLFGFARPTKGWRSAERRTDACEASLGPALSSPLPPQCGGRPPPGARTVAILGAVAALPLTGISAGSVTANSHIRVVVPGGGPLPPGATVPVPPPQDATPRSPFRMPPGDPPPSAPLRIFITCLAHRTA